MYGASHDKKGYISETVDLVSLVPDPVRLLYANDFFLLSLKSTEVLLGV